MRNSDLRDTKEIIDHSKGIDKSYSECAFLLNLNHSVKGYVHFVKFLLFLRCPLTKSGHVTWPKMQILIFFFIFPDSRFNNRKSHKISRGKPLYFRRYQEKTDREGGMYLPPPSMALTLFGLGFLPT